ncbi:MAG TPA: alanine racemase [Gemmatimonadales bacterium]|nr:alanine racemase [Gemmatimonadales bacterium]
MTSSPDTARAWVDIDLDALVANARAVVAACGSRLLPMLKANGYGLGAVAVARALEPLDPWGFGIATPEEGAVLRTHGVARPLLLTTPLVPEWIEACLALDLRPAIGDVSALQAWLAGGDAPFHLEIDTGMARAGLRWDDEAAIAAVARLLERATGWEGAFTHFHSADTDPASAGEQWGRFQLTLDRLPRRPPLLHAANSAAALQGRCYAADLVRPGIFLYGGSAGGPEPRPVAALRTRVVAVRTLQPGDSVSYDATWKAPRRCTVATLGIGYADGVPRANGLAHAEPRLVELGDTTVPLVGRVTMDMCMVAVDDRPVAVGDMATIFGGRVTLDAQARAAGTISYELLTALGPRVVRRYKGAP